MSAERGRLPKLTDRLLVGELSVSPFCLGMVADPRMVAAAFRRGINFFFVSSDLHWPLYEPLRRGLSALLRDDPRAADEIVVAMVSYVPYDDFVATALAEGLQALAPGVAQAALLVAGSVTGEDYGRRLDTIGRLVAKRHLGALAAGMSFHDHEAALAACRAERALDIVFSRYNALRPSARTRLLDHLSPGSAPRRFCFKTTGSVTPGLPPLPAAGEISPGSHADAYRFALSHPSVDGLLVSPQSELELDELEAGLEAGPLSIQEQVLLTATVRKAHGFPAFRDEPATLR